MQTNNNIDELHETHTPAAIRERLRHGNHHSYLRDFIYGAIDGTVTTFAIVAGVAGAGLSAGVTIVLGFANLLADGFSMAVSNFLATRAEDEQRQRARRIEEQHIAEIPEGEREEIRQIFAQKGFEGEDLERAVDVITSDVNRWVDMMMQEELGLPLGGPSPWRAAAMTFFAFVAVGIVPLLTYLYQLIVPISSGQAFGVSVAITCCTFFAVGAVKSRLVGKSTFFGGLETLAVGGIAASLAFFVGVLLHGIAS